MRAQHREQSLQYTTQQRRDTVRSRRRRQQEAYYEIASQRARDAYQRLNSSYELHVDPHELYEREPSRDNLVRCMRAQRDLMQKMDEAGMEPIDARTRQASALLSSRRTLGNLHVDVTKQRDELLQAMLALETSCYVDNYDMVRHLGPVTVEQRRPSFNRQGFPGAARNDPRTEATQMQEPVDPAADDDDL